MKYTVSFFKRKIKDINDGLEKENYVHRLRGQFEMEKGQLKKVAFYYRSVHVFQVRNKQAILTSGMPPKKAEHWLDNFEPKSYGFEISQTERFVNGFDSWNATHFELVRQLDTGKSFSHSYIRFACQGREVLYELAREMTDRFEQENREVFWTAGCPLQLKSSAKRTMYNRVQSKTDCTFFSRLHV
ncbi:MAG: hypothetical protein EOO88_10465 [Pedobacter sp.]|nr:MAG: hypothetical protein EOO88_10465 [Pedobacter sp.]